jgi:hypothetical protein
MVDETTKNLAKGKIDALTIAIGYANIASNDTLLDNYYDKVRRIFPGKIFSCKKIKKFRLLLVKNHIFKMHIFIIVFINGVYQLH